MRKSKFSPVSLILLSIFIVSLLGVPYAYFFNKAHYVSYFTKNLVNEKFILISYLYSIYALFTIFILYYILGLKKRISLYIETQIVHFPKSYYMIFWWITYMLVLVSFVVFLIQMGGKHPAISAIGSDYFNIQLLRQEVHQTINMNIFNISFRFILPFNIILAFFFLRKRILSLASLFMLILMGTFVLEKIQIFSIIILLVFFRMLISKIQFKKLFSYSLISLFLIAVMFLLTKFATSFSTLFSGIFRRIFYGQISDLPHYFELFSKTKISFGSLLPPYIADLIGMEGEKSASRLIMEHLNPEAVSEGTAGVANTFFTGEAYAAAGHLGVIVSPFLVMVNLVLFIYLFSRLKKNIIWTYLFAWFMFRVFQGIFGGISYFIFSGPTIIFMGLIYLILIFLFTKYAKESAVQS